MIVRDLQYTAEQIESKNLRINMSKTGLNPQMNLGVQEQRPAILLLQIVPEKVTSFEKLPAQPLTDTGGWRWLPGVSRQTAWERLSVFPPTPRAKRGNQITFCGQTVKEGFEYRYESRH